MDTPITVTQQELQSLSPEVRAQIREAITTRCIAVQENPEQTSEAVNFLQVEDSDDEDELELPTIPTFAIPNIQHCDHYTQPNRNLCQVVTPRHRTGPRLTYSWM